MALRPYNILGAPEDATDVLGTLQGYTATATAAGTTTLTDASTALQVFTGTTTQTVVLPVTSTIVVGVQYTIANKSTGAVTVNASDASLVATVAASSTARVSCNSVAGTTNAAWTVLPTAAGGAVSDGDKGDVIVSGSGAVWSLDYTVVNATVAPVFANVTSKPTTLAGYGITDGNIPSSLLPISGDLMGTCTGSNITSTVTHIADRMDIFPYVFRRNVTISAMKVNVITGIASALAKLVVYDCDSNGRPTTLLFESASTLDFSTTGEKTSTASLTFTSGKTYWFGLRSSSTAAFSTWAIGSTPFINGGTGVVTTARTLARRSVTFASGAPNPWVWDSSEIAQQACPAIWLVVA